jgi:multiple sugar transport system substrate-binding protein
VVDKLNRGEFLRRAGVAAAGVAVAGATAGGAFAGPLRHSGRQLKRTLSVVQWQHFESAYDTWFDSWAADWGNANDVTVTVDHVDYTTLPALAAKEAKAQRGHDVFGFLSSPAGYEDQVIDHSSIVSQVESQVGPYSDLGKKSTYNPRTKTYFGVSDSYVPAPLLWRFDLWNAVGESPATWDHVRNAAPSLKAAGYPIGIGQSNESDSNTALTAFLLSYGAQIQDESNALTIASKNTIEAVQYMADLYRRGEDEEIFGWNPASNNAFLLSGRGSMIVNAISAIRTAEQLQLPYLNDLRIWPMPAGPAARLGLPQYTSVYSIWKFSKNTDVAQRFIADLCAGYKQATLASSLFNYPSFPGAFPLKQIYQAAAADPNPPRGKYSILTTIAAKYTRQPGYPGYSNPAIIETLDRYLIPQMFAQVSQGKMTATDSVQAAAKQMQQIWAKWQAAKKI